MPEDGKSASPADEENKGVTDSAATPAAKDDTPDSSPAGQEGKETLHDVIESALTGGTEDDGKDGEPDDADTETDEAKAKAAEKAKKEGEQDPDAKPNGQEAEEDDEGDDLPEGQRVPYDRFQKVVHQRNSYRKEVEQAREEATRYKQGHEQHEAIQNFMRQNDLRVSDVAEALELAALFNRDPAAAAKRLAPKLEQLQRVTGDILPDELQRRVDTGELTAEDAREIVRTRAENARLQREREQTNQRHEQQARDAQLQGLRQAMADAANQAQNEIMASDPDYAKKEPLLRKELTILIGQKPPRSPEDAAKLVREAHSNVTREIARLVPRREVRPGPRSDSGSGASTSTEQEPKTMSEAIRRALDQG